MSLKLLYAHDHKFYNYKGEYYSNGSFSSEVLKRYLSVFGNMTFISRQQKLLTEPSSLTKSSVDRVTFVEIPNFKSIKQIGNRNKAKKIVEENVKKSDFIIARLPSAIGSMTIRTAIKYGKPYLIEVVGCALDAYLYHGSLLAKIISPFEYINLKRIIYKSPNTIYITETFLQKRYPTKGKEYVIPNVLIEDDERKLINKSIKSKVIRIGLIGSLNVSYKGQTTLMKAISYIKENKLLEQNIIVEFVGEGNPEKFKVISKELNIQDDVRFIGTLPNGNEVNNWLDSLDIQIQPSLAEAQGRSIIEGMSRGLPIIATKVGGIVELLDDSVLIKRKDYINLANILVKLINEEDFYKSQSLKNYKKSREFNKKELNRKREIVLNEIKNQTK